VRKGQGGREKCEPGGGWMRWVREGRTQRVREEEGEGRMR
jgi:hypothetical protein